MYLTQHNDTMVINSIGKEGGTIALLYYLIISLFVPVIVCSTAFSADEQIVTRSRPLLHTFVEIKAWGENADTAIEEAFVEMERVNSLLNNYDTASDISKINQHAGGNAVAIHPETMDALRCAIKFCTLTGGALDITVGPLLRLWGFGKDEVGLAGGEPGAHAIQKAKSQVDYRAIELSDINGNGPQLTARLQKKGMWIDVGSFSKGFVADKAMAVFKKRGIRNALVIAGGTVCAMGHKPDGLLWQVGVQHPRKQGGLLTVVSLKDASISTSGDYEIFYEKKGKRRAHIIDPRTGLPKTHLESVSVIAVDGMTSDALSTALFVLGTEKGIALVNSLPGVEALIVSEGGKAFFSKSWPQKVISY
jgi:thiamine biosynthesis lipoprotein